MTAPRLDIAAVAAAALSASETLVPRWLPDGKREGPEWRCGSLAGERGSSLGVNLRTGQWSDFATGEKGGDLVSLYAAIHRVSQLEAAKAVADELGMVPATPAPKPRTDWTPVLPVPADAPAPPVAHINRGRPEAVWAYKDLDGRLLGYVYRFRTSDGGKEVLPLTYTRHETTASQEWRWISFPRPRPLYGLDRLSKAGEVLLVEGEKCADAAAPHWPGPVVTWPGGSNATQWADLRPLAGRQVVCWPDADCKTGKGGELLPPAKQPGQAAMERIARALVELGCTVDLVQIPPPGEKPDGWDVADAIAEGLEGQALVDWVQARRQPFQRSTPPRAAAGPWPDLLIARRNGTFEDCRENVMLALMHHPELQGMVARDDFAGRAMRMRTTPWGAAPGEWNPTDDRELGLWLAQQCRLLIRAEGTLAAGVEMAAQRAAFHPVKDYLAGLRWDGTSRIEHWLQDCLGADDTLYARRAGAYFLIAMVARVMRPGCKADHMLVLEGPQGRGKSSALRVLAGEWFSDAPFRVGDKDSFLQLDGVWLYEISEMDSFNRAETTAVKAFVTQITDRFREPYGRRVVARPRQTMLAGTTNQDRYLRDMTGNRRFWPVRVGLDMDVAKLAEWRDQLFAEAAQRFHDGAEWWPSRLEEQEVFVPQQDERVIEDPWVEIIAKRLEEPDNLLRDNWTAGEILGVLGVSSDKIDAAGQMAKRVQTAMTQLGWGKPRRVRRDDGTRPNAYVRPARANVRSTHDDEVPL